MNRKQITATLAERLGRLALWLVSALVLYLAICAWYNVFQFAVFAGDDLRSFPAALRGFSGFNEMMISYYKFRPVTAVLFGTVAQVTGGDFRAVASVSLMLHTANGLLFFYVLSRKICLPLFLSIAVTAIAVFNRFGTYLFMQDSALTGGLAVALFLLFLIVAWPFLERPTVRRALCLITLYAAIIHTYEPYLVLGLPLVLLGIFTFRSNRAAASVAVLGALGAALGNLVIKKCFLGTPVLIGTETRPLAFDVPQILSFLWQGFLNLVGINAGPAYLSLEDFPDSPLWMRVVSMATAVLSVALVLGSVASVMTLERRGERRTVLLRLAFGASVVAGLLLSASITFRQLYSWLYPAYLGFLVFLSFAVQTARTRHHELQLGLVCLVLLSIPRELYLSRYHSRFFAFQVEEIANSLADALHHIEDLRSRDAVVIRGTVPSEHWVFLDGAFSRFYHLPALEFISRDEPLEQTDESRIVLDYSAADRSFKIASGQAVARSASPTHRMSIAALETSANAFVPNDRWSTPTKTPAFRMLKNGVDSMIAVSPVEMSAQVPPATTALYVCFSHVYAIGDGADLEITAVTASGSTNLLSRRVPPLVENDLPVWRKYEFTLPTGTTQVQLRVMSKTDAAADWVAIRDFSFN